MIALSTKCILLLIMLSTVDGFFYGRLPAFSSPRKIASLISLGKTPVFFRHSGSVRQSVELNDEDFRTLEANHGPKKETKIEIYHNGDKYEGEFLDGKRHGQGVQYFARVGKSVVGEFRKGKIYSGEGTLYIAKTNNLFEGTWLNGQFTGYAEFATAIKNDTFHYAGQVVNGQKRGYGKLTYPNGQVYVGNFECNVRHGFGKVVCPSGKTVQGEFRNDRLFDGTGTMEYIHGCTFTGTWVDGWWQGPGILTTGDGVVYEGDYNRGRLFGPGYVTYPDGHKYNGTFANGKMSGGVRVFEDQINSRDDGADSELNKLVHTAEQLYTVG